MFGLLDDVVSAVTAPARILAHSVIDATRTTESVAIVAGFSSSGAD